MSDQDQQQPAPSADPFALASDEAGAEEIFEVVEEAIVEDVMRAAQAAMMTAHLHCPNVATAAADRQRPVLRHGVTISGHFDVDWAINHLPT